MLYDDDALRPATGTRRSLIRVARKMSATLSDNTDHGYVFHRSAAAANASVTPVCARPRPPWPIARPRADDEERAAYIKAQPCAGNFPRRASVLANLRPFVWRKHLDFAAIQDAHDMRLRIP